MESLIVFLKEWQTLIKADIKIFKTIKNNFFRFSLIMVCCNFILNIIRKILKKQNRRNLNK